MGNAFVDFTCINHTSVQNTNVDLKEVRFKQCQLYLQNKIIHDRYLHEWLWYLKVLFVFRYINLLDTRDLVGTGRSDQERF